MLRAVVEQHAEEAAFLWTMRRALVKAPHARLEDLDRVDERIEASLDGLSIAGRPGWEIAMDALPGGDEGEVFVAAALACQSADAAEEMAAVIAAAPADDLARGLAGALSWLPGRKVEGVIDGLRGTRSAAVRRAALIASCAHRRDAKAAIDAALLAEDWRLRATALRAIGELGRRERVGALAAGMQSDERACRFWAAWSAALLGNGTGAAVLRAVAVGGGVLGEAAATYAAVVLPESEAAGWIDTLTHRPALRRVAIQAAAARGDPSAVPWLIDCMREPALARLSGHALTTITGIAIAGELAGEAPSGFTSGPSDDPADSDVTPDPDDYLAWPNVAAVSEAWAQARADFPVGARYLLGRPVGRTTLVRALAEGRQPDRLRAAFELALEGDPLCALGVPARRQRRALAAYAPGNG